MRKEPEEFLMTEVRLGRKLGDSYEVLEGLEPGSLARLSQLDAKMRYFLGRIGRRGA